MNICFPSSSSKGILLTWFLLFFFFFNSQLCWHLTYALVGYSLKLKMFLPCGFIGHNGNPIHDWVSALQIIMILIKEISITLSHLRQKPLSVQHSNKTSKIKTDSQHKAIHKASWLATIFTNPLGNTWVFPISLRIQQAMQVLIIHTAW